jgi:hypothetical protein
MGMTESSLLGFAIIIPAGGKRSPVIKREPPRLQRWPVSKQVNSSKADVDDATLIEQIDLAAE